jgi:hypothetical protein
MRSKTKKVVRIMRSKTHTNGGRTPRWKEQMKAVRVEGITASTMLEASLHNEDYVSSRDIGQCTIPLLNIAHLHGTVVDEWYPFYRFSEGSLRLRIQLAEELHQLPCHCWPVLDPTDPTVATAITYLQDSLAASDGKAKRHEAATVLAHKKAKDTEIATLKKQLSALNKPIVLALDALTKGDTPSFVAQITALTDGVSAMQARTHLAHAVEGEGRDEGGGAEGTGKQTREVLKKVATAVVGANRIGKAAKAAAARKRREQQQPPPTEQVTSYRNNPSHNSDSSHLSLANHMLMRRMRLIFRCTHIHYPPFNTRTHYQLTYQNQCTPFTYTHTLPVHAQRSGIRTSAETFDGQKIALGVLPPRMTVAEAKKLLAAKCKIVSSV